MTVPRTYGDLQYKIADELGGRTDLLVPSTGLANSPIQLAILDAIRKWEREHLFTNETRVTSAFSTVAGQEFYTSSDWSAMTTVAHIDKMSVLISANRYFMWPRTAEYMEDISINPNVTGQPVDYCYYAENIRMYPIPDAVYPVNVLYVQRVAELSATSDSNIWTNEAEELIRQTAKMMLYENTLQDDVNVQRMANSIWGVPGKTGALTDLKAETFRRSATQRMRATYF